MEKPAVSTTPQTKRIFYNSLTFKTSFYISVLLLFALIVISAVFIISERTKVANDIVANGKVFASFSNNQIYADYVQYYTHPDATDFENFKTLVQGMMKNNEDVVGVSLIAFNGRIMFDSDEFKTGKSTETRDVKDVDLLQMLKSEDTVSKDIQLAGVGDVTEIIVPMPEISGGHILSMRYLISNRSLSERMNEIYKQIAFTVIPLLIVVVLLAIPYTVAMTRPIIALTKVAEKVESGDLTAQADIKANDEIASLAKTFNGMVVELGGNINKLKTANEEINKGWLQIQQEKAKLSASIENMPVGFLMTDIAGNVLVLNTLIHTILGAKDDADAYETLKKILAGKVDIPAYLRNCGEDTKPFVDRDASLPDGRFLKIFLSPILTQDKTEKKCTGIVVLVDDITEVKLMERSKDEFFSIASHELRTPLTAIRGNTSLMKDMYADQLKDPELLGMVNDTHDSAIRLINIVNDFLNVSRLEMGKIVFKKDTFDLVPLGKEVVDELKEQADAKRLVLKLGKSEIKSLNVFSDRDRTKEVLINLVGNAIKYTEKGEIDIDFAPINGSTKISVRDTGNGITPEGQKLLFRKFQQAGESILTRDTTRSTGLGLYISKMIIEGMGGRIWLESSTPGKGSVFSFTLPTEGPSATSQASAAAPVVPAKV